MTAGESAPEDGYAVVIPLSDRLKNEREVRGITQSQAARELQVLVDEGEQLSLMHLTFFNDEGTALDVTSALVLATPTDGGDAIQVPTQEFEPGHYVTTVDLEPGEWTFEVSGNAGEGGDFDTTFNSTLG